MTSSARAVRNLVIALDRLNRIYVQLDHVPQEVQDLFRLLSQCHARLTKARDELEHSHPSMVLDDESRTFDDFRARLFDLRLFIDPDQALTLSGPASGKQNAVSWTSWPHPNVHTFCRGFQPHVLDLESRCNKLLSRLGPPISPTAAATAKVHSISVADIILPPHPPSADSFTYRNTQSHDVSSRHTPKTPAGAASLSSPLSPAPVFDFRVPSPLSLSPRPDTHLDSVLPPPLNIMPLGPALHPRLAGQTPSPTPSSTSSPSTSLTLVPSGASSPRMRRMPPPGRPKTLAEKRVQQLLEQYNTPVAGKKRTFSERNATEPAATTSPSATYVRRRGYADNQAAKLPSPPPSTTKTPSPPPIPPRSAERQKSPPQVTHSLSPPYVASRSPPHERSRSPPYMPPRSPSNRHRNVLAVQEAPPQPRLSPHVPQHTDDLTWSVEELQEALPPAVASPYLHAISPHSQRIRPRPSREHDLVPGRLSRQPSIPLSRLSLEAAPSIASGSSASASLYSSGSSASNRSPLHRDSTLFNSSSHHSFSYPNGTCKLWYHRATTLHNLAISNLDVRRGPRYKAGIKCDEEGLRIVTRTSSGQEINDDLWMPTAQTNCSPFLEHSDIVNELRKRDPGIRWVLRFAPNSGCHPQYSFTAREDAVELMQAIVGKRLVSSVDVESIKSAVTRASLQEAGCETLQIWEEIDFVPATSSDAIGIPGPSGTNSGFSLNSRSAHHLAHASFNNAARFRSCRTLKFFRNKNGNASNSTAVVSFDVNWLRAPERERKTGKVTFAFRDGGLAGGEKARLVREMKYLKIEFSSDTAREEFLRECGF